MSYPAIVGKCSKSRKSNRCSGANAFWQYDGICIDSRDTTPPTCHVPEMRRFSSKLVATVVPLLNTPGAVPIRELWARGAGPGLSWERSVKMTKVKDGYWVLSISYDYDSNALLCLKESRCSLNQKALEFRVYRDEHGLDGMLGPNIYIPLPISNSISGHSGFSPPYVFSYPWFDGKRVLVKNFRFYNAFIKEKWFSPKVYFTAFYPPSYEHNTFKHYPVVITFGSNLEKMLVPLLESMYVHESNIEEAFVFALHTLHHGPPYCVFNPFIVLGPNAPGGHTKIFSCPKKISETCYECMTCLDPHRTELCDAKEFSDQAARCGYVRSDCYGYGDTILDNIENIILPEMSVRTMGRLKIDYPKDRISIIGIDGAGLLACYAALSRPMVYKNAGCMSAPFHWPLLSLVTKESRKKQGIGLMFEEITDRMKLRQEFQLLHATQKFYIDVGEFDNDYLPIVDEHNYSDWVVEQMKSRLNIDQESILYYRNVLGGGNSDYFLNKDGDNRMLDRIKVPLLFFLKPEGGLNADYPRTPYILSQDYTKQSDEVVTDTSGFKLSSKAAGNLRKSCKDFLRTNSKTVSVSAYLLSIGELCAISVL